MSTPNGVEVGPLAKRDYEQWEALFRAYIDFYKTTLPDSQYRHTFDRIVDPESDLGAIVLRKGDQLVGIAHFFPHQTPWSQKAVMHLNDLFIDPKWRGSGYGRALINAVADQAKFQGCFRLEWDTQHLNPARKLYDQVGVCTFVKYEKDL